MSALARKIGGVCSPDRRGRAEDEVMADAARSAGTVEQLKEWRGWAPKKAQASSVELLDEP